jgi:hypothetical protein
MQQPAVTSGKLSVTKLSPPRTLAGTIARSRLSRLIDQGVRGALTLVVGPAGSGKTVLVWLFWFPLIGIALGLIGAVAFIRESGVRVAGHVNVLGAALLSGWLVALLLGVSEAPRWHRTSARRLGLFAEAALLAVLWVIAEARSPQPLIDMRVMRRRGVWTVNAVGLMLGIGISGRSC